MNADTTRRVRIARLMSVLIGVYLWFGLFPPPCSPRLRGELLSAPQIDDVVSGVYED